MIYGLDDNKTRIEAKPGLTSKCPTCSSDLIAKCGVVKKWHWAHKSLIECDSWSEPESEWHINWKEKFDKEEREIVLEQEGIKHRADIKLKSNGRVIEFQSSPISPDDVCDRELFYNNMVWLLDGETLGKNFTCFDKGNYLTFSWKNPPQSFFYSNKNLFIDCSSEYNRIKEEKDDAYERINLVYQELKKCINGEDPNKYDFSKHEDKKMWVGNDLVSTSTPNDNKILEQKKLWSELSRECNGHEKDFELFGEYDAKTIFLIKKLYKKIPCGGWGYLITKEDFIKTMKNG